MAAITQGPWTDLGDNDSSEYTKANRQLPFQALDMEPAYNRYMADKYGDAILTALLDSNDVGDKTSLIINLVQIGIDYYGLLKMVPNGVLMVGIRWDINCQYCLLD